MNKRYERDLIMGQENEIKFKKFMNSYENIKLKKYKDKYAELDFRYQNRLLELKSRTISHNQFPTTIVGENKIKKARRKNNFKTEFYFLFTDGLYRWDYNEDEILCIMDAVRTDRGRYEVKPHAYISIKNLKLINNNINSVKSI